MINYGFTKELEIPFNEAVAAVTAALKKEGFGVLTTIDVREKFKEKIGVAARAKALSEFTLEKMVERTKAVYYSLL